MDILKNIKNKSFGIVCVYLLFYLFAFFALEQLPVRLTIIHCSFDEKIPFCEYFIIPYVLWFFYVGGTVLYFYLFQESSEEYGRLIGTLATGMTMFVIISFVWPNRHMLRPNLTGDSVFIEAVRLLYRIDTPTNIFPSIHVFNTMACYLAIRKHERCREKKWLMFSVGILSLSIILSTMFLKQHTVIDVVGALVLNWGCYGIFYKWLLEKQEYVSRLLNKKQICTRPNFLNLFRMGIAILFWGMSERLPYIGRQAYLVGILLMSFFVDGAAKREERKCLIENKTGKLFHLIADRITQGVLLLHLMARYRMLEVLLFLILIREVVDAYIGARKFIIEQKNSFGLLYEKLNFTVLNMMLFILMLIPGVTKTAANFLIFISELLMGGSLLLQLYYARERRNANAA